MNINEKIKELKEPLTLFYCQAIISNCSYNRRFYNRDNLNITKEIIYNREKENNEYLIKLFNRGFFNN